MALWTFGSGTADVTTNAAGDTVGGVALTVWSTRSRGSQVTDLYDLDGNPLPGYVTSAESVDAEARGRVAFKASDTYSALFLWDGNPDHEPWGVLAIEATTLIKTAIDKSDAAFDSSQSISGQVDDLSNRVDRMLTPDLDILTRSPEFVGELFPVAQNRVGQSYLKDWDTGGWWLTQVSAPDTGAADEDAVVSRCAPDGTYLDSMVLVDAGHGTKFGVEHLDDGAGNLVPHLWWVWAGPDAGGTTGSVVRLPYAAGTTLTRDGASVEVMSDMGLTDGLQVGVDDRADLLCFRRISAAPGQDVYELRRLSDVVADFDEVLGSVSASSSTTLQGFGFDGTHLYVYHGSGSDPTQPVEVYQWSTGALLGSVDMKNVGVVAGESHEPESAQVFTDPASGIAMLLVGIGMGVSGRRRNMVYGFTPPGGSDLNGPTLQQTSANAPVVQDGQSRRGHGTTMTALTTPGWWYLPTDVVAAIDATDWPSDVGRDSGWWLNVSGVGGDPGTGPFLAQQLVRVSGTTTRPDIYYRVINTGAGTKGLWERVTTTQVTYSA